jgi:hypothetical protein
MMKVAILTHQHVDAGEAGEMISRPFIFGTTYGKVVDMP